MEFGFTDEQEAIRDTARRFAADKIAPGYRAREDSGLIDRALVREMGALGLIAGAPPLLPEGPPTRSLWVFINAPWYKRLNSRKFVVANHNGSFGICAGIRPCSGPGRATI